jgi:hypothetical protein
MISKLIKTVTDIFKKKSEKTPHYDQAATEVRNLLKATGATFIPKLCNALKEDWYPDRTEIEIQNNEEAREDIKDKILRDWSLERAGDEMGVWKESSIMQWFQICVPWLADPVRQQRAKTAYEKQKEKMHNKYYAQIEQQKIDKKLESIAKITPPAPKEEPNYTEPGIELDEPLLRPIGEEGRIPLLSMGEINSGQYKLWTALTGKEDWAHTSDDLQRDIIKPTREYRKALFSELQDHELNGIARRSSYLIALLQDTIETIELLQKR